MPDSEHFPLFGLCGARRAQSRGSYKVGIRLEQKRVARFDHPILMHREGGVAVLLSAVLCAAALCDESTTRARRRLGSAQRLQLPGTIVLIPDHWSWLTLPPAYPHENASLERRIGAALARRRAGGPQRSLHCTA